MQKVARNEKVVRNTRSCQKVAEQLVESPKRGSLFGCPWGQRPIKKYLPSMSKNYKLVDRTPWRHLRVSFLFHWGWFLQEGGGAAISGGLANSKSIWIKQHWIIAWGYWPYIFAGWLSKYSIQWGILACAESAETDALPRSPREKLRLAFVASLSECAKKTFLSYKKGIIYL